MIGLTWIFTTANPQRAHICTKVFVNCADIVATINIIMIGFNLLSQITDLGIHAKLMLLPNDERKKLKYIIGLKVMQTNVTICYATCVIMCVYFCIGMRNCYNDKCILYNDKAWYSLMYTYGTT